MLNDTQPYIIVMDTLLKETVDLTVNSRYPGMAPEGRRQIEEVLIRKEVEKGEILLKEGQISHNLVFVGSSTIKTARTSPNISLMKVALSSALKVP